MIAGALFFYQYSSVKNRLATRIKRLRKPNYLVGAIVGGLYLYFYLFRMFLRGGRPPVTPEQLQFQESIGALVLMTIVLLAWVLPHTRSALAFTEAEAAFLFPAPISRRALINFKLLKSQAAILFSSLLMTIIGRGWGGGNFVIRAFGCALTMLMDRGISNRQRRAFFIGIVVVAIGGIYLWARATLPPVPGGLDFQHLSAIKDYASQVLNSGPLPYLLFPFRLMVAPYFSSNFGQFFIALGPALAIIALHYWWVTKSNVAFEEASLERSRKDADRIAAARSGNWRGTRKPKKAVRPPFALAPIGNPAVAVLWKNLISAGQYVTARVWFILVWSIAVTCALLRSNSHRAMDVQTGILFFVGMLMTMSLFSGPQMLRNDLRQDLPAADLLKMYPMRGWQIALGEVLAPSVMLAAVQWLLLVIAFVVCPPEFRGHAVPLASRLAIALTAAIVLPFVDFLAMLIPNASVLLFPAWFQLGKEAPRGFETTGQQLILMFGQILVLVISLIPAGIAFAVLFFAGHWLMGAPPGMLLGGIGAAGVLAFEAFLGIKVLGGVFDRFDLSEEVL
jgi:hypothetical protein